MPNINPIIHNITIPGTRQFSNRASELDDSVNLTLGVPDFNTDESIKKAANEAIKNKSLNYSHNAGLLQLRQAVSQYYMNRYEVSFDPVTEVLITNGGSQGIDSTLRALLEPGDEVVLPEPIYVGYRPIIEMLGAKVITVDTSSDNFKLDPKKLENALTDQTKAIILNYPTNPTGVALNKEDIELLVEVIEKNDVFLISDEIYAENTLDHTHYSFVEYPSIKDKTIVINGLSKSHSMTGWRIGFLVTNKELMQSILIPHLYSTICASIPSQYGAIEALTNGLEIPKEMNDSYRERRDYLVKEMAELDLPFTIPTGAFYIFPSIKKYESNSYKFATKLLEEQHMAVVPGAAFGESGEGYIRISFAAPLETIKEGVARLKVFLEQYNN